MLHILLLILKILLWIVLGALGLVILLILLVLLTPIHYRAAADVNDEKMMLVAKVRFLIVSVGVAFDREDKELKNTIRVLGIRLGKREGKKEGSDKKARSRRVKKKKEPPALPDASPPDYDENYNMTEPSSPTEELGETVASDEKTEEIMSFDEKPKGKNKKEKKKKEKQEKGANIKKTGENKLDALSKKLEAAKTKYNRFLKFWRMNCTVKTRRYLKKYFPQLIKHILPRNIKGHVKYGLDDPSTTGQITGYLSLLPFVYQKNFYVEPYFQGKVLECDVNIKGFIQLGYIIRPALKLHLWKTIKMARKI